MRQNEPSITAKICAFTRAHHSIFTEIPIYNDYYAYELLGEQEYNSIKRKIIKILSDKDWQIPTMDTWDKFINNLFAPIILSRMKYAEEQLFEYAGSDESVQYVICGAGLDTFIFRNHNQNIETFELDHPNTKSYKINRLNELGWNIPDTAKLVSIDFEKQRLKEVLLAAGFAPNRKSYFAIMGVTYYLSLDTFAELLKEIASITKADCRIVFDYPDKERFMKDGGNRRMSILEELTESLGEQMMGGMNEKELADVFHSIGFHISEFVTPQLIQERFLTSCHKDLNAYENVCFVTAKKDKV